MFRSTSSARRCSEPLLAAALGLPYAFASHFAPDALEPTPSPHTGASSARQLNWTDPYVIAGVNVVAADTTAEAQQQFLAAKRSRAASLFGRGRSLLRRRGRRDPGLAGGSARRAHGHVLGGRDAVRGAASTSTAFAKHADADELIVVHHSPTTEARLALGRAARGVDGEPGLIVQPLISLCAC